MARRWRPSSGPRRDRRARRLVASLRAPPPPLERGLAPSAMEAKPKVDFGSSRIHELPMTDDDCDSRLTHDEGPKSALGLANGRVARHRQGQAMGPVVPLAKGKKRARDSA